MVSNSKWASPSSAESGNLQVRFGHSILGTIYQAMWYNLGRTLQKDMGMELEEAEEEGGKQLNESFRELNTDPSCDIADHHWATGITHEVGAACRRRERHREREIYGDYADFHPSCSCGSVRS